MNKEEIITAEEFIREKIRKSFGISGEMKALNMYAVSGEDALRWAHEFVSIPTHKEETIEFSEWVSDNGWRKLDNLKEWSNGEIHRTTNEIYEIFKKTKTWKKN